MAKSRDDGEETRLEPIFVHSKTPFYQNAVKIADNNILFLACFLTVSEFLTQSVKATWQASE